MLLISLGNKIKYVGAIILVSLIFINKNWREEAVINKMT